MRHNSTFYRNQRKKIIENLYKSKLVRNIISKMKPDGKGGFNIMPLTPAQEFISINVFQIGQVEASFENLTLYKKYLNSTNLALEKKGVSRVAQFIHHAENYLSATYIFQQRVKKFTGFVRKQAQKLGVDPSSIQLLDELVNILEKQMANVIEIRGSHIHQKSYRDDDILRMQLFDSAVTQDGYTDNEFQLKTYKELRDLLLKVQRVKWNKIIDSHTEVYEAALGSLYKVVEILRKDIYHKMSKK